MQADSIEQLVADAGTNNFDRRDLLKRAAALGLSFPAAVALFTGARPLSAFAQDATPEGGTPVGATNPLGVDPAAPLDVVIFKGGFGDNYAINVNENLWPIQFPDSKITYQGIQRLGEQLQPRFVAGNPPDVIDNSGAGNLDNAALVADGQLADLADLMAAQSWDTADTTFADTLVPGTQDSGVFDGKQLLLNWALTVEGLWFSQSLMTKNGWEYPKTWAEFLTLCETIKATGIAPFATTGVYPQYILGFVFNQMVYKNSPAAAIAIDNLEDNAWKSPSVKLAAEALNELGAKGYMLPGWEGLTHTESQAEWLQGKAVFLPCGTWLENEMKGLVPDDFEMTVMPIPSLEGDELPFEAIIATAGEPFIVPSAAANVQGGKEWLRLLFSVEGGRFFAEDTKSLSVVKGSGDGLDLGTAFASTQAAITAAGENTFPEASFGGWYADLQEEAKNQLGAMVQQQISVDDFMSSVQEAADAVRDDDSVVKYTRTK